MFAARPGDERLSFREGTIQTIATILTRPSPHTNPSEQQELCEKLLAGEPAAMEDIFRSFCKRLFLFVLKMIEVRTDAEEIVQDVLLKFWLNARDNGVVQGHLEGYLFSMVRNRCLTTSNGSRCWTTVTGR